MAPYDPGRNPLSQLGHNQKMSVSERHRRTAGWITTPCFRRATACCRRAGEKPWSRSKAIPTRALRGGVRSALLPMARPVVVLGLPDFGHGTGLRTQGRGTDSTRVIRRRYYSRRLWTRQLAKYKHQPMGPELFPTAAACRRATATSRRRFQFRRILCRAR